MKKLIFAAIATIAFAGCGVSTYSSGSSSNDLYGTHDRLAIAQREKEEAEIRYLQAEARRLDNQTYEIVGDEPEVVLVEEYDGVYAQRLHRFDAPVYILPPTYYAYTWDVWSTPVLNFGFTFGVRSLWYDPWYSPWYGSWYDPWYGLGWNYGWNYHHHHYNPHYSWGGYYRPSYYGPRTNYRGSALYNSSRRSSARASTSGSRITTRPARGSSASYSRGSTSRGSAITGTSRGTTTSTSRGTSTGVSRGTSTGVSRSTSTSTSRGTTVSPSRSTSTSSSRSTTTQSSRGSSAPVRSSSVSSSRSSSSSSGNYSRSSSGGSTRSSSSSSSSRSSGSSSRGSSSRSR